MLTLYPNNQDYLLINHLFVERLKELPLKEANVSLLVEHVFPLSPWSGNETIFDYFASNFLKPITYVDQVMTKCYVLKITSFNAIQVRQLLNQNFTISFTNGHHWITK